MVRKYYMNKNTKGAAWFDTECREAIKRMKGVKLRKFRKTKNPEDRKYYAALNKSYRHLTRRERERHTHTHAHTHTHDVQKK